ncbi:MULTISPECIES: sigma-70 family RNA polymerase sigma factor [Pedobacter]|uniref:RNA polymerase sigma-70 factor n=1 Tax=Pedobacter heparinus (strain ATCC 13125 / DSM 2366 / CIP 104194 / JCM 7457 / NBRC 12017 / NCIMB 9290 / NRRL B-14731 / HIM 762-3) TaxID=485917 RepID=C6XZP0_PEDHD|nr:MULTISPECIES: sigma-70 family RNA polymerase sigma factor [Pedobacter]ACU04736.1 RNA polymerase sigma-70 factor [Pedobacter heparinus DSM 2366]MBB5437414.1 RNA polymerase sigma-70 factor (ECF subfamily) [Pedobacter sp. AK017]
MVSYGTHSDNELAVLLKEADKDAYTEIYNRYWKKMLLLAWNHCKDKSHAEDIVHEVFIALWNRRDGDLIMNVPGFLTTAIKFNIFKHYQKVQQRKQLALKNYEFKESSYDEDKLDALFLKEYINGIVEQLPEKCRLTFKYSREEGLNNAEIADRMNISEKGVEANLTRALKIIRGNLKDSGLLLLLSSVLWKNLF